jgi:hypothetical protein
MQAQQKASVMLQNLIWQSTSAYLSAFTMVHDGTLQYKIFSYQIIKPIVSLVEEINGPCWAYYMNKVAER